MNNQESVQLMKRDILRVAIYLLAIVIGFGISMSVVFIYPVEEGMKLVKAVIIFTIRILSSLVIFAACGWFARYICRRLKLEAND